VRVLVTGITGFAGSFLAEHLIALGAMQPNIQIWGVSASSSAPNAIDPHIDMVTGDLTDAEFTSALFGQISPDRVYHLAAQAFVPTSWQDPWATLENNIRAQLNLLEAAHRYAPGARILVVASQEEYGHVRPEDLPIDEDTPLSPNSPYGVSKVAQDYMGLQYFNSHHQPIVRVRPFNHIGPRQNERFVAANFAKQVAEIELGLRPPKLCVGNLDAQRDFTDVRDMVRAYVLALERGTPGDVYNLGSGRPRAIHEIVNTLRELARVPFELEYDPERMRPSDTPVSYCDVTKFHRATGWQPEIPFMETLRDTLDYWRERLAQPSTQTSFPEPRGI